MTSARELGELLEAMGKRLQHLDLPNEAVERIDEEIKKLDELVASEPRTRGVLEWWGVGKEFWREIDVDEYVRNERESWR
jgi:hypothetical protein